MRFYTLLNFQHVVLYLFPTLVFILLFGIALAYSNLQGTDTEKGKKKIHTRYPEGIEDMQSPFPLSLILIILGTVLWVFFYILGVGILEVKI
jgi:hypothetical protein